MATAESETLTGTRATGEKALAAIMWEHARAWGDKPFAHVRAARSWKPIAWRQLADDVGELGRALIACGIKRGDRVAILSNTRYEWTAIDYAILSLGAITVPIYQTSSAEEVEYILNDCGARLLFIEDFSQAEKVARIIGNVPTIERIVQISGVPHEEDRAIGLDSFRKLGVDVPAGAVEDAVQQVEPGDVATYIYTSGTTGNPKGCIITNHNFSFTSNAIGEHVPGLFGPGESTLLFLPLAHGFARMVQFKCVDSGMQIYYGNVRDLNEELKSARPTFFISVPRMFEKAYAAIQSKAAANPVGRGVFELAKAIAEPVSHARERGRGVPVQYLPAYVVVDRLVFSKVREALGGRVKYAVSGGSALAPDIAHFFNAAGVPILEGYGLTETSAVSHCNRPENYRVGTVGKPLPGVEVKVAGDGEVLIKGDNIFQGYYNSPEKTAETLTDGWLHSGDIGEIDAEGNLRITGRKKDLIITAGGKNIGPQPLEDKLKEHRYISQVVMIGDRRPYLVALVTVDAEETEGVPPGDVRQAIQNHFDKVNAQLGRVEQVKKFTVLDRDFTVEDGEITPTMKVKRAKIADLYADEIEKLYAG